MKKSQKEVVKQILREEGKIDNFRCFNNHITLRLGDIIFRLKKEGWVFKTYFSNDPYQNKNYVYELITDPETVKKQYQADMYEYYKNKR